jgi:hypothetical protein
MQIGRFIEVYEHLIKAIAVTLPLILPLLEWRRRKLACLSDFSDKPLSVEDLIRLRQRLSHMSARELGKYYQQRLRDCRLQPSNSPPKCESVQSLVAAWRSLRARHQP